MPEWHLCQPGQDEFGRHSLTQPDPSVSIRHFALQRDAGKTRIIDLQSTNGTKVNGQPIQETGLHPGDKIECGRQTLYWLGNLLLLKGKPARPIHLQLTKTAIQPKACTIPDQNDKLTLQAELWETIPVPAKSSLILTMTSSLMMTAGTLLSSAVLLATGTGTPQTISTTMIMSLSMSCSMLAASLLQRHSQYRQAAKAQTEAIQRYDLYLQNLEQTIRHHQQQKQKEQQALLARYTRFDPDLFCSNAPIPIGWQTTTPVELKLPAMSYRQRQEPLYQKLEQLATTAARPIHILQWLPESGTVTCHIPTIQALYAHVKDPDQWKWTGKSSRPIPHQYHQREPVTPRNWNGNTTGPEPYAAIRLLPDKNPPFQLTQPPRLQKETKDTETGRGLKIRLGQDPDGSPVFFDLEQDGPHGLVCGTTGSGKSEGLTLLLARLAGQNSPEELQFLLLDFKGGSFAGSLVRLPHCAGIVTNLDKRGLRRLILALQTEMDDRQRKMNQMVLLHPDMTADMKSYNQYGNMSRLVIVCDEFAQLKSQYPEDLEFLQNTARIGRSLGIHLILSTQKPAGIVSAQILANTAFTLCFRVQNEAESLEVIQTRDAARLQGAGSCIFRKEGRQTIVHTDYIRQPKTNSSHARMEQNGKCIKETGKCQTELEHLCQQASHTPCRPLVLPPLHQLNTTALIKVDDPANRKQYGYDPDKLCILTDQPEKVKASLKARWPGLTDLNDLPKTSWWFVDNSSTRQTILTEHEEDLTFFENPGHRFLLVTSRPARKEWPAKVHTNKEDPMLYIDKEHQNLAWPSGWLEENGRLYEMEWNDQPEPETAGQTQWPDLAQPADWQACFTIPCLGHWQGKPVFYDGRPIQAKGKTAKEILERSGIQQDPEARQVLLSELNAQTDRWDYPIPCGLQADLFLIEGRRCQPLEPLCHG